jgi:ATP-dependent exoDNAse (exonuclease V) beta subunit
MSGPNLLRATLGAEGEEGRLGDVAVQWLRTHGKQHWFEEHALLETATQEAVAPHPDTLGEILRRHHSTVKRSTPSGEEAFTVKGSAMFSAGRERGRRMGTLVHDLLAEIEWLDGLNWPDVMALWRRRGFDRDPQFNDAADSLRPVLEEAATRRVFQKPSDHAQAWREKPFEVIHEGRWISGTMDRVILTRDAAGRAVSAWLVDFKTDDVPDAQAVEGKVGGYRPQVELYRLAISRLTGLRAGQVRASLLFTRARKVVEIQ